MGGSMSSGLGGAVGSQLTALLATAVSAQAIKSVVDYGARIQDLSDRYGVSTDSLQQFGNAAEKNGSSLEAVAKGFQKLEVARSKALQGDVEMAQAFLNLGVTIDQLEKLKPDQLMERLGASSMKAAEMVKILGRNSLELRPTLAGIADGTIKLGDAIDKVDIERLKKADDTLKTIGQKTRMYAGEILGTSIEGWSKTPEIAKSFGQTAADTFHKALKGNVVGAFKESAEWWRNLFGFGDKTPMGKSAEELLTPQAKAAIAAMQQGKSADQIYKAGLLAKPNQPGKKKRDFSEEDDDLFAQAQEASKLTLSQLAERDEYDPSQNIYRNRYIGDDIAKAKAAMREKQLAADASFSGNEAEFQLHTQRYQEYTRGINSLKDTDKQKTEVLKAAIETAGVLQRIEKNTAKQFVNK